ncbi:MAG: phospholipid carrier-dependent glycosyltransferase [Cyanothece sp. SIO2G6]|nr:phospholipid carrier-dependent glycosyltransferase [Cyanothece sp. SIO2G6]
MMLGSGLRLYQVLPVLAWLVVGLCLRLHNLALKPPWSDEFSTLVFGLGHGYNLVPLNQIISAGQLLSPLEWSPVTTVRDTVQVLLTESNHPPLYFALTHQWMDWIQPMIWLYEDGQLFSYVSFGMARLLSALFGALGVPVMYLATWWMWRSHRIAHFATILMALSPFGIYLAQEARHYTLTVIWLIGSLACLVAVMRCVHDRHLIPVELGLAWVILNGLGLATHYFFALSLLAEAIALIWCWWEWNPKQVARPRSINQYQQRYYKYADQYQPWLQAGQQLEPIHGRNLGRVGATVLGTMLTGVVWLPSLLSSQQGGELIRWVQTSTTADNWSQPLVHTAASIASMIYLLPIQGVEIGVIVLSGLILMVVIVTTVWTMIGAIARREQTSVSLTNPAVKDNVQDTLPLVVVGKVCLVAIAIMAVITYGFGLNISPVFRYHFVYFPAVLLLMAWGLTQMWVQNRWIVVIVLSMGLCGALTVSTNLGYQKLHRPDQVVQTMLEQSHHPVVMSISHQSHGQTGRLMAVAWEMRRFPDEPVLQAPQFFLDHQPCDRPGTQNCNSPSLSLRQTLDALHESYELWLVNYLGTTDLKQHRCHYHNTKRFDGYKVQHYTCSA